jgi:S1-C subfamily serine protease
MNALGWGKLGLLVLILGGVAGQAKALDGLTDAFPNLASCQEAKSFEGTLPGTCQGAASAEIDDAGVAEQKRKEYVKRALSKSAGRIADFDLSGKQLVRAGSGFFVAEDGTLVTSAQLISECALISISPTFGKMATAMAVAIDRTLDLALLRPDVAPPAIASFTDSDGSLHGEQTYLIGYPSLGAMTAKPTMAPVKIIGSQRTIRGVSTMVVEGPVLSGNDGGALLDSGGGVIGVVLANENGTYAATGSRSWSVGLVLPNETLQHFLQEHGVPDRSGLKLTPKSRDRLFIDAQRFMVQVGCWH